MRNLVLFNACFIIIAVIIRAGKPNWLTDFIEGSPHTSASLPCAHYHIVLLHTSWCVDHPALWHIAASKLSRGLSHLFQQVVSDRLLVHCIISIISSIVVNTMNLNIFIIMIEIGH